MTKLAEPEFRQEFIKDLTDLINRHSVDNELATPDYVVAENILENLRAMRTTLAKRDKWHGGVPKPEFSIKSQPTAPAKSKSVGGIVDF